MIEIIPFDSLGHANHGWLDARHHFSFAHYYDPARMGFGPLRVWNDDTIAPRTGFDPHPHRDMEIITYIHQGAITHRDSLGNEGRTAAGDVQVMSAGTGIVHAEYNLESEPTRLFQIWVEPRRRGLTPRWANAAFPRGDRAGRLIALASGQDAVTGTLPIDQDATLYAAALAAGDRVTHALGAERRAYLVPATGRIRINDHEAGARDGATAVAVDALEIEALEDSDLLLFDLP
jgi:redox-sensitive bicupin YhaK (pirin superfamily)